MAGFFGFKLVASLLILNPKPEACKVFTTNINSVAQGTANDIVLTSQDHNYYIKKGLKHRLNLDSLNTKVLNKTVTLHLAKTWFGTTEHVAQLAVANDTLYTEFK